MRNESVETAAALAGELKRRAMALGFSLVGIIDARPARRLTAYREWLQARQHGAMAYMARPDRVARREDLGVILPGVRTMVCVGLDYFTETLPAAVARDPSRGRISNYAWGLDYHDVMTPRLETLAQWLEATAGTAVASRVYVDTGAILERDHAETAGLGFTGKNTMLIAPRRGSWLFLGELLTTLPLPPDPPPPAMPSCGSCRRCLIACPTDAFPRPYVLDARRCISYLTIELKDWIPRELRPLMGNWIYGCDICQDVCPFNRFARPVTETAFQAAELDQKAPRLLELLALDEPTFARRFATSPIRRLGRARLVRNAAVAAGNWGHRTAGSALRRLLREPAPLVRGHAVWALGRLQGAEEGARNRAALLLAAEQEDQPEVRREIELALQALAGPDRRDSEVSGANSAL